MTMKAVIHANDTNFCPNVVSDFSETTTLFYNIFCVHQLCSTTIFVYDRVRDVQTFASEVKKNCNGNNETDGKYTDVNGSFSFDQNLNMHENFMRII